MTYTLTTDHDLDGISITAEWSYSVLPGYPATRIFPAEHAAVDDVQATLTVNGKAVDCPDWLFDLLRPSDETLLEHAGERDEYDACDAADYRRELREDAA